MSKPFRERNPVTIGLVSIVVLAALLVAALKVNDLPLIGGGTTYYADFTDASGLKSGDEVRIAGVRVGLHWSVLVIVALITVALAHGRLPAAHPGHSPVAYWGLAVLTAVVFLLSLLAHELAHAVVARRNGVEVEGITLWMLGGAARLRGEAPSPAAELRIAGVGPLTSLLAGGVLTGAAVGLDAQHAYQLARNSFEGSFAQPAQKKGYIQRLDEAFAAAA